MRHPAGSCKLPLKLIALLRVSDLWQIGSNLSAKKLWWIVGLLNIWTCSNPLKSADLLRLTFRWKINIWSADVCRILSCRASSWPWELDKMWQIRCKTLVASSGCKSMYSAQKFLSWHLSNEVPTVSCQHFFARGLLSEDKVPMANCKTAAFMVHEEYAFRTC